MKNQFEMQGVFHSSILPNNKGWHLWKLLRCLEVVDGLQDINHIYGLTYHIDDILQGLVRYWRFVKGGFIYGSGIDALHGFHVFLHGQGAFGFCP